MLHRTRAFPKCGLRGPVLRRDVSRLEHIGFRLQSVAERFAEPPMLCAAVAFVIGHRKHTCQSPLFGLQLHNYNDCRDEKAGQYG
jgi:hypothetical protein